VFGAYELERCVYGSREAQWQEKDGHSGGRL
jgi:hypothetical protein